MPSHYAEQEEQIYLKSHLHDLEIRKNALLELIQKNEVSQREVKDKIEKYNGKSRSRYYQLNFWEKPSESETYR
tara:strand:+ start:195 stop:416 length:222 start_codon:yes stop_codon:yes gene_type:complete